MRHITKLIIALAVLLAGAAPAVAQENAWPRTVALDEGMVTIYQPQIEALDGDMLYYRAALAYRPQANAEPVFGAGWFKSPVQIDNDDQVVHPARLELTQTRFPDGTADVQAELASALAQRSPTWNLDFSVAELEAALDAAEAESLAAQQIKTAPPKIIYRDHPALLVTIDGDPVLREIEDSPYQAVINTPYPLISDGKQFYLNAAKGAWYRASAATGPYRFDASPPAAIVQMVESAETKAASDGEPAIASSAEAVTAENAPEIVVTTGTAELIVTEGPADFVPLVDNLLVLQNSDDDVFLHVNEQQYYIVLAGRWYKAPSLNGPWAYQAANALPADFANIPDESAQADSRVYVAGTPEAQEAVLDAHIPQTAAVQRGQVDIDVDYDGEPDFEPVEGTENLTYARNTGATVLHADRVYYLLEDGVWYVASSPDGPWVVSDHRPGELESISPESPVYNTKYVYVYDSTPEVVYVGYTPGYVGSYVYANTIVYGTGYYYRPWISPYYYYPRPRTWGFHVGYNDWTGWNFGLSWYWGPLSLSYYTGGYWHYGQPWYNRYWGYWGPRGYAYRPYYYGGYRHNRYAYNRYGHGYDNGYKGYGKGRRYDDRNDKYRNGRGDSWDRDFADNNRYDRQRNRNLYRDDRQRAPVSSSRDRQRDGDRYNRGPGRNDNRAPDGNDNRRRTGNSEQRYVAERKIRESQTGPVRRNDLRKKADVRDVNRAASRDKFVANNRGEVHRAAFDNGPRENVRQESRAQPDSRREVQARAPQPDKSRKSRTEPVSRTEPISRNDLRKRGENVAKRPDRAEPSVSQKKPEARSSNNRAERQVTRPEQRPTKAETRAPKARARDDRSTRQITSEPRRVASNTRQERPGQPETSPPRQVAKQRAPQRSAPQRSEPQERGQARNAPQRSAPQRSEPQRSAPQKRSQARSAPQRSAPQRAAPQRSEPQKRSQARSAPQRSAPQRSAPQRSAPQRSAPQRSAPQRSAPQRSAPQRSSQPRSAPSNQRPQQRSQPNAQRSESRGSNSRGNGGERKRRN